VPAAPWQQDGNGWCLVSSAAPRGAPTLDDVVRFARAGRGVRLHIPDNVAQELKRHGRDAEILKRVVRALIRARDDAITYNRARDKARRRQPASPPETMPMTEEAFLRVARRIGDPVSQKKGRRLIHVAVESGLLVRHGHYTSRRWRFNVPTFRLGCRVAGRGHAASFDAVRGAASHTALGVVGAVKPLSARRWWLHPLFGTPDGLPPPSLSAKDLDRWRSHDERHPRTAT
jgi:hypothetical protein